MGFAVQSPYDGHLFDWQYMQVSSLKNQTKD